MGRQNVGNIECLGLWVMPQPYSGSPGLPRSSTSGCSASTVRGSVSVFSSDGSLSMNSGWLGKTYDEGFRFCRPAVNAKTSLAAPESTNIPVFR